MTIPDTMENGASSVHCTPDEEKRVIKELMIESESNLKEGNLFFVVSNRWFTSWKRYVERGSGENLIDDQSSGSQHLNVLHSLTAERPGPIDNSDIILSTSCERNDLELIRTLEEERDYVLLPQIVWEKLIYWYEGGPALPRKMIELGSYFKKLAVEVYPLSLELIDSRDHSHSTIRLSKKATTSELFEKVCSLRKFEKEKLRIWDYFNKRKHAELRIGNKTLEEANLQMGQYVYQTGGQFLASLAIKLLLEVKGDGYYPSRSDMNSTGNELALVTLEPSISSSSVTGPPTSNGQTVYPLPLYDGNSYSDDDVYTSSRKGERGGLAGLQNLGNTCFMNSALQCLGHTPPIFEYFLQDYRQEINTQNPLGMHGELALAFGELLRKLWSSGKTSIAPRVFKGKLARFAPQFSGYNQHDSQELLAFLLDGLHEDLNRVKQKPYIEAKDSDGRLDREVADESWKYHKARNDSIIVDVCQGQYKSTLVCPACSKISITFDPFMYLSLPLPSNAIRTITVTVIYGDGSGLPMPYTINLLRQSSFRDLQKALATACCLKSDESLLLADVYEHGIFRYYESPSDPLSSMKDDDHFVAYRIPKDRTGKTRVEVSHQLREKTGLENKIRGKNKLLGTPLVTYLDDPIKGADIEIAVSRMLSPLTRRYPSSRPQSTKENGFASDEPMSNCNGESGHKSIEDVELEEASTQDSSLHLSFTRDKGLVWNPVQKDTVLKPGELVKFMLDWTEKEHELYDISYLEDLPVVFKAGCNVKKTRQEVISLFSCLEEFMKEEPLGPDDMWYCPGCKEHRQATKKLDLWRLPDILVFHLKRFSYSRFMKTKIDTFVNFPIQNLDLSEHVISEDGKSRVYNLFAISNHYGGLGGGHYTAYAKLIDENRWYHFDDSHVGPVDEEEIKTSAAYVLFYQRVNSEPEAETGEPSQP